MIEFIKADTYEYDKPYNRYEAEEIEHPWPIIWAQDQARYHRPCNSSDLKLQEKINAIVWERPSLIETLQISLKYSLRDCNILIGLIHPTFFLSHIKVYTERVRNNKWKWLNNYDTSETFIWIHYFYDRAMSL